MEKLFRPTSQTTIIPQSFYLRPVEIVARELLGKLLCRDDVTLRITEVEAYGGSEDSASHCRSGKTLRNAPMWGMGGHCYVYLCYGVHQMLNVVTGHIGAGSAVLIRSCEVLDGFQKVMERRKVKSGAAISSFACDACFTSGKARLQASRGQDLQANPGIEHSTFFKLNCSICNGPGKVGQALAIDGRFNNHPLFESGGLELREGTQPMSIERTRRIGIEYADEVDKCALLRFAGLWNYSISSYCSP